MLETDDLLGRRLLVGEAAVEPLEGERDAAFLVAQAHDQLDGEGAGERTLFKRTQERGGIGRISPLQAQEGVRQSVGLLPGGFALHHAFRQPAQVFHEHDPQADRQGPDFADIERRPLSGRRG